MENADRLEGVRSTGEYVLSGNVRFRHGDLRLETGDVVFVPMHGPHVAVTGEVKRPDQSSRSRPATSAMIRSQSRTTSTAPKRSLARALAAVPIPLRRS